MITWYSAKLNYSYTSGPVQPPIEVRDDGSWRFIGSDAPSIVIHLAEPSPAEEASDG